MKAIVIYYSFGGNTETIAEDVQKATDSDMERVETRVPYKGSILFSKDRKRLKMDSVLKSTR